MLVRVLTSSNKTVFRPVHLWNAFEPIVVTVLGMVTEVRTVRSLNAELAMLVKFVPMMMLFIVELLKPVASHQLSIGRVKSLPAVTKVTVFI